MVKKIWIKIAAFAKRTARKKSLGTFSLFLLLACFYWGGHAFNSQREKKVSLPIEYIGIPDSIMFEHTLPTSFTVYLRDIGKRLWQYNSSYFNPLPIDLTKQFKDESGKIHVTTEQVRKRITDHLQGTTQLQQIHPENINVVYHKQHQKKVPLVWRGNITLESQYQMVQEPVLQPASITIFGSQEDLKSIQAIETESVTITGMKDSFSQTINLIAPEKVRLSQTQAIVTATAELFTEKVLNIAIATSGVPDNIKLRLFPPAVDVTIRIGVNHFHEISAKDIEATCIFPTTKEPHLPVNITYSSPYITFARCNPMNVEYIIERQ